MYSNIRKEPASQKITIQHPEILVIDNCPGANQSWYYDIWQQRAGCGPTNCALNILYLGRTRPSAEALLTFDATTRQGFTRLMDEVWTYVTPGKMGVNSTDLFCTGAMQYGRDHGVPLLCNVLDVPAKCSMRPSIDEVRTYLSENFYSDHPVAFLNLSNGKETHLDNWHWVTLVGFYPDEMKAIMYDQGREKIIDLSLWLTSTLLGGGFVSLDIDAP